VSTDYELCFIPIPVAAPGFKAKPTLPPASFEPRVDYLAIFAF